MMVLYNGVVTKYPFTNTMYNVRMPEPRYDVTDIILMTITHIQLL